MYVMLETCLALALGTEILLWRRLLQPVAPDMQTRPSRYCRSGGLTRLLVYNRARISSDECEK